MDWTSYYLTNKISSQMSFVLKLCYHYVEVAIREDTVKEHPLCSNFSLRNETFTTI